MMFFTIGRERFGGWVSALLAVILVFGLSVVALPAHAASNRGQVVPPSGAITLAGCEGSTSTPAGNLNTPGPITLTGQAAADLRAGKAVFLYDNKGQIVVSPNGSYNGAGARLAYCGAKLVDDGTAEAHWRFCTDELLNGCAGQPPAAVEGNPKLDAEQEQAIAHLLSTGDTSSKRSRSILQLQVWCVSEFGTGSGGNPPIQPGNVMVQAQTYFNTHLFSANGTTPENMRLTDEESTCAPWATIPDDPALTVTGPAQQAELGDEVPFTVTTNFTGDVALYATGAQPIALCPPVQQGITLTDGRLYFATPGTAIVCVMAEEPGGMTLTARGDDIPLADGLDYLWNGNPTCQVFADYSQGPRVDVVDRGEAVVRVPVPGFELGKTADPVDGTDVNPGDVITYTVTGSNTGETVLEPVVIDDDLSGLWNYVTYNDDAFATINGTDAAGDLSLDAESLSWVGLLAPGETVTITYSVTVNADAVGQELENRVTASGTPPSGPPIVPPPVDTEHPVPTPGFDIDKTANPTADTTVNPGDVIEYTVTGTNTGETTLDPVVITDDFSGLSGYVTYNDDVFATIDGTNPAGTLSPMAGDLLVWTGALGVDESVTITYSVTVNPEAAGILLENRVTGEGTPPSGPPIVPPPVDTEHPVPTPGFELNKSADPESGSEVNPGDDIVYTVSASNTGETILDPVILTDDVSGLGGYVTYNDDVFATINGTDAAGTLEVDREAALVTWTGVLNPGQTLTITYSVTVNADATGQVLQNVVDGQATPPGHPPIVPPPTDTEHPVPAPGFTIDKTANPVSGTVVNPDESIEYTITGTNTGETQLDPVVIDDDLSGLGAFVTYNDDVFATINGTDSAGTLTVDRETQTAQWTGALAPGESVTITYSVVVAVDAAGMVLQNTVYGSAKPPGRPPIVPPPVDTEHPVPLPGFELGKSSDPRSGATVKPGQRITYTVTGVNTGETVLDPVVIDDDMSGLHRHATYNDDAVATIGGTSAGDLVVDEAAHSIVWTGALQVGETVTITYSVTVKKDAGGQLLTNTVTGSATPPGHPPIEPPPVETEHRVPPAPPAPPGALPTTGVESLGGIVTLALLLLIAGIALSTRRLRPKL